MILHNITRFTIENEDTIENPLIFENGQIRKFDRVLANPPFSQNFNKANVKYPTRFRQWCPETGKKADKFAEIDESFVEPEDADTVVDATKPKALNNFAYPVRITDNEVCKEDDTKLYCADIACPGGYIVSKDEDPTDDATAVTSGKCVTNVLDPLWDDGTTVILETLFPSS